MRCGSQIGCPQISLQLDSAPESADIVFVLQEHPSESMTGLSAERDVTVILCGSMNIQRQTSKNFFSGCAAKRAKAFLWAGFAPQLHDGKSRPVERTTRHHALGKS